MIVDDERLQATAHRARLLAFAEAARGPLTASEFNSIVLSDDEKQATFEETMFAIEWYDDAGR